MHDVIIAGAGCSGLYAGYLLQKKGIDFRILEARDRVGGRVLSEKEAGYAVDLGAQWIGPGQTRMYALAEEFGLETAPTHHTGKNVLLDAGGTKAFKGPLPPLGFAGILDSIQLSMKIAWHSRSGAFKKKTNRFAGVSAGDWVKANTFTKRGRDFWTYLVAAGTCADPGLFSARELFSQLHNIGGLAKLESAEQDYFPGGVQSIPLKLAETVPGKIEFEMPVTSIEEANDGSLVVNTAAGKSFKARHVIVAMPPQLYPKITASSLGEYKVPEVATGIVTKNILIYDTPWWRELGYSGLSYSTDQTIGVTLDTSPDPGGPGILVAIASGPKSEDFGRLSESERQRECEAHVAKLFGKQVAAKKCHTYDWTSQEWSLGGYASRIKLGNPPLALSHGPVYFAGTEVAPAWSSYMEGGLRAAEQAVDSVLDSMADKV